MIVSGTTRLSAQVSPGPLSRPHTSLEGNSNCLECHGRGDDSIEERCAACHTEIAFQQRHRLGLHGTETGGDCASCHPEHAGLDFELIDWGKPGLQGFDHIRTGWRLAGKHANVTCRDCHRAEHQTARVAGLVKREDRSWLGLERDCVACHEDYHRDELEDDCSACHDPNGWRPASRFDHERSRYPLTGAHAEVECAACHPQPAPAGRARFAPLAHAECSDCHADPHENRLGAGCTGCHVTAGFRQIRQERFDHARTRYPLVGRHTSVSCESCHDSVRAWGKRPRFDSCDACHSDAHAGTATIAARPADCGACHDETGFEKSTYTPERHRASSFPLDGKHATVACRSCHTRHDLSSLGDARVQLRPAHAACTDCHENVHAAQVAEESCESCHSAAGWSPSTYDAARHAELDFALHGAHSRVECLNCHGTNRPGLPEHADVDRLGSARIALSLASECRSCHFDPHDARLDTGCVSCHVVDSFRPSLVDSSTHETFDYELAGAHRATPCSDCHDELSHPPAASTLLLAQDTRPMTFEAEHEGCLDCHASPHGDQFSGDSGAAACVRCHDLEAFRPASRFDHDRDASFALTGGHEAVPCASCHRPRDGSSVGAVVYRPLPQDCRDCHTGPVDRGAG